MTLGNKIILIRVGEVLVLAGVMYWAHENFELAKRIFCMVGAFKVGQMIGGVAKQMIQEYQAEEVAKNKKPDSSDNG